MIRIHSLTKVFDGRGIAGLHGINLELNRGEILSIMGPNGSGKSTLLKILAGEIQADSGQITIDGPIHLLKTEAPKDQNVQKFLIQKITLEIDEEKKVQLARDLADIFEFTFQLRQNISQLSAGQLQKVLLASELINRPNLVLLDEPFTHLDPFTRQDILKSLFNYLKDQEISLIWVTHEMNEALKFSDRIGILNFGKLIQVSNPQKIVFNPANLFVAQFIGHQNFIPIKKENSLWLTPWGKKEFNYPLDEAILVIPHHSWSINSEGMESRISKVSIKNLSYEYEVLMNDKAYFIHTQKEVQNKNSKMLISPNWDECFLIPL
ncbi:MAG: ABC transporter ATP-binding protein [Bacteriovoracaceae bacterium]